jgi:two-component system OmpR family sensor kinase
MNALSLRARLMLATVALVALGLLAADAATYALLRSSLIGRIDRQLRATQFTGDRFFVEPGPGGPGFGGPAGPDALAAPYVALLTPSGEVHSERYLGFGPFASLQLPAGLPGSSSRRDGATEVLFTAGSGMGRYRVVAKSLGQGLGTWIVAFPLGDVAATLRRLLLVEGLVTAGVVAGAVALALWLVRLGLRPLTQMEGTAAEIAAGDLSRRVEPAEAHTEVGRLGLALNEMLGTIEAAFAERRASEARLRRFVADASHELRTPLTSIRGYAELFRRGADERPDDLAMSMRRIEDESARMGVLVDELLLLARLDQGPSLERAPVDLADVARDAVTDARAVQPDRPITLDAVPAVVDGDEARLRQVAANLLSNALVHTPAGTPVRVRVGVEGGEATLEVADEGPGLEPDHAAKAFDRFFRADPSRSRDDGGAGLGLAIVAAVVEALGGRASVDSAPGEGARFTVVLPLRAPDEPATTGRNRP